MTFDPERLLAAMPRRAVGKVSPNTRVIATRLREEPKASSLGEPKEYNGFTWAERDRTAKLSVWLAQNGATMRPASCDICGKPAPHEHAENYYDLSTWVGLCVSCHVHALHKRYANPAKWNDLLDRHDLPQDHWTRLVSAEPFDLAAFVRLGGQREPRREDFA